VGGGGNYRLGALEHQILTGIEEQLVVDPPILLVGFPQNLERIWVFEPTENYQMIISPLPNSIARFG